MSQGGMMRDGYLVIRKLAGGFPVFRFNESDVAFDFAPCSTPDSVRTYLQGLKLLDEQTDFLLQRFVESDSAQFKIDVSDRMPKKAA
jgi:hypothetical protein